MIRLFKILLVIFVGLQGLFYFISNLMNWASAKMAVGTVLGQADSPFYQNQIVPPITDLTLVSIALAGIMTGELLIGLLSFKGAADMLAKRNAPATAFNAAKKFAVLGGAMAMVVWFGIFQVFGAGLFQMWQGQVGISSFEGAFMYHSASAIVVLFVCQTDE